MIKKLHSKFLIILLSCIGVHISYAQTTYGTFDSYLSANDADYTTNGPTNTGPVTYTMTTASGEPTSTDLTVTATISDPLTPQSTEPDEEGLFMGLGNNTAIDNPTPQTYGLAHTGTNSVSGIGGFDTFTSTETWETANVGGEVPMYVATVTYTFSEPVVDPVIHFDYVGGGYTLASTNTGFSTLYQLQDNYTMNPVTGSNNFGVGTKNYFDENFNFNSIDNVIYNSTTSNTIDEASGSVKLSSPTPITSVTFKVYVHRTGGSSTLDTENIFSGDRYAVGFSVDLGGIKGQVLEDTTSDGAGDEGMGGESVELLDSTGAVVATAITSDGTTDIDGDGTIDPVGSYFFGGLAAGDYTVRQVQPAGYESVSDQDQSPDGDTGDSDTTVDNEIAVTITGTEVDTDNNFVETSIGLPVKMINFLASLSGDDVELTWTTASENNNSHFNIQRSLDGVNFETIGEINGAGTTSVEQTYSFTDANLSTILGTIYYRLEQVDFDGATEYSNVRLITLTRKLEVKMYPNPVYVGGTVTLEGAEITIVELYDEKGKLMEVIEYNGGENLVTFTTSNLAKGVYVVNVNGSISRKLIVQ